eukprot:TRINITY_DN3271_c0_g3_i1.p2 TRINITY_DN3271_c0_g3~~TRINITY_DN3271_c0_g3_i1.p2  ORF type:complete len:366 (+),score=129.74 TRINITY_DN3271_c0_g3_i1:1776-2873(+)
MTILHVARTTDSIPLLPFLLVIVVNMASIAATEAWTALTKDEFDTNWILFGFQKGSIEPVEIGRGNGGLSEFRSKFDECNMFFGGIRIDGVDDRENVVSRRDKYAAITFVGEGVSGLQKAKVLQLKGQFDKDFSSAHIRLQLTQVEELDAISLAKTLLASGGAHKPRYYDFLDGTHILLENIGGQNEKEIFKATEETAAVDTAVKATYDGPTYSASEGFNEVFKGNKSDKNWLLLGFPEGSQKLDFLALGSSGFSGLTAWFDNEKVNFAALKVIAHTEKEGVNMQKPLLVSIIFVGKNVRGIKKMRALQSKSEVERIFIGVNFTTQYGELEDVSIDELAKDLAKMGGDGKCTKLDFGGGNVVDLE